MSEILKPTPEPDNVMPEGVKLNTGTRIRELLLRFCRGLKIAHHLATIEEIEAWRDEKRGGMLFSEKRIDNTQE